MHASHIGGRPRVPFEIVNLRDLNRFPADAEVTPARLREAGLVDEGRVKVLGMGTLDRALTVKAQAFSKSAAEAIERAGGKAEVVP
jgi:large subunit ribosomal protein L15